MYPWAICFLLNTHGFQLHSFTVFYYIHYIIHMFIHLLSVSPARIGAPQGQGFFNALIIAMCSTPRTVPGTWQAFKKRVEK